MYTTGQLELVTILDRVELGTYTVVCFIIIKPPFPTKNPDFQVKICLMYQIKPS